MNEDEKRQILFMIDELEYRIDSLAGDIQNLKDTSTSTNDGTSTVALDNMQSAITTNRGNIALLRQSVNTNIDNITLIQTNISEINERLISLENSLQTLQTNILANGDSITKLQNGVSTNGESITALQNSVANNSNSIKEMQSIAEKTNELTSVIDELQTQINTLETSVNSKQDALTAGDGITIENNVISVSGSKGLTDEQATQIQSMQATINNFITLIKDRNASTNPTYMPYDDAVIQTSDILTKNINFSGTLNCNPGLFMFRCDKTSNAVQLKITILLEGSNSGTGVLYFYLNSNDAVSKTFNYDTSKKLYTFDFSLPITSEGNFFYITLSSANNIAFEVSNITANITNAINPMFLNQEKPFNVDYYSGKYYITNCVDDYAQICVINKEDLATTNDIIWNSTGIQAQTMFTTAQISTTTPYYADAVSYGYLTKSNNQIYFENKVSNTNNTLSINGITNPSSNNPQDNAGTVFATAFTNNTIRQYKILQKSNGSKSSYSLYDNLIYGFVEGIKPFYDNIQFKTLNMFIIQKLDGNVIMNYGGIENTIGFGKLVSAFYDKDDIYTFHVYLKEYNRIVRYIFRFTFGSLVYTLISKTIMGDYDWFFEGANDDYFTVKNNQLFYYKNNLRTI